MNASARIGNWMDLGGGRRFWPLDPRADEVDINDIAHALSMICRFGGRCSGFYSVAQHSVHVSEIVARTRPDLAMHALLHDAAEAYLGDIIAPLKEHVCIATRGFYYLERFEVVEQRVLNAVHESLRMRSLTADDAAVIKRADMVALATEARDLMGDPNWPGLPATNEMPLEPYGPRFARQNFMTLFRELAAAEVSRG